MRDMLIQGAADWEIEPLIEALEERAEVKHAAWTFWKGRIGESAVVVSRTDWGPINAVAATITGIEAFRPRAVICQGMAGAHRPDLNVGDVIVAERSVDTSTRLKHRLRIDGALTEFDGFAGDERLVEAALAAPNPDGRVLRGTAGSAYQFNRDQAHIGLLRQLYGTDCEDMESAFAAGAAALMRVPFVAVRMISNSEWKQPVLDRGTGRKCARFVLGIRL